VSWDCGTTDESDVVRVCRVKGMFSFLSVGVNALGLAEVVPDGLVSSHVSQPICSKRPAPAYFDAAMPFKMQMPIATDAPAVKRFKPARVADMFLDDHGVRSQAKVNPPTDALKGSFVWSHGTWMSIDVETHDLAPPSKRSWENGEFGHVRRATDLGRVRALRVVQIGWAIGDFESDESPVTKVRFVKPDGFEITPAAAAIHKITQDLATEGGVDLRDALCELMSDLRAVVEKSGRVCAHNLEFDATILSEEMSRAGLDAQYLSDFDAVIRDGFCTFDPTLTRWCCEEFLRATFRYAEKDVNMMAPVGLKEMVRVLDVQTQKQCLPAHDAGADARAVWLVLRELHRLVRGRQ